MNSFLTFCNTFEKCLQKTSIFLAVSTDWSCSNYQKYTQIAIQIIYFIEIYYDIFICRDIEKNPIRGEWGGMLQWEEWDSGSFSLCIILSISSITHQTHWQLKVKLKNISDLNKLDNVKKERLFQESNVNMLHMYFLCFRYINDLFMR